MKTMMTIAMETKEIVTMNKTDLYKLAQCLEIKGRSVMNKTQLIEAIVPYCDPTKKVEVVEAPVQEDVHDDTPQDSHSKWSRFCNEDFKSVFNRRWRECKKFSKKYKGHVCVTQNAMEWVIRETWKEVFNHSISKGGIHAFIEYMIKDMGNFGYVKYHTTEYYPPKDYLLFYIVR